MALSQAGVAVWVLSSRWNQELLLGAAHPPTESFDLNLEAASECDEEEEEGSSSHPTPRLLFFVGAGMLLGDTGTVRRRLPVQQTQDCGWLRAAVIQGSLCLSFPSRQWSAVGTLPPNPTTPKAFGDMGCWRHWSSFSQDPSCGLVYITDGSSSGTSPIHSTRVLYTLYP